jgi:hypothetical protein
MRRRKATLDSSADFPEIPKNMDFNSMNFDQMKHSQKMKKKDNFKSL